MWSIAICDDSRRQCRELAVMLEDYSEERRAAIETEIFDDPLSMINRMKEGKRYSLIFLDVLMQWVDGIEVGRWIRRGLGDEEVQIVYISKAADHMEMLFANRPLDFLRKPLQKEAVYHRVDYARSLTSQSQMFFLYRKKGILYQVAYKDIRYFQSVGRKIQIHTPGQIHEFYGKLSDILARGLPVQFVQIHQSYIVNRNYIIRQSRNSILLRGEKGYFSISQPYRDSAEEKIGGPRRRNFDR